MVAPVIQALSLSKVYPGRPPTVAVDGVSFVLEQGQILGLLGPNGAGKTTTIQMLLSTLKPSGGSIEYFGRSLETHRSEILSQVGFGSAYSSLVWRLTVEENLDIFGRLAGVSSEDRARRIKKLLSYFGAEDLKKKPMAGLSAGQRTRVVLCKVFIGYPKVALLDEPTASLDPDVVHEVRAFIRQQQREYGVSMVYTSHNMSEVTEVCDEVLFLSKGKILSRGTPDSLAASIAGTRVMFDVDPAGAADLREVLAAVVSDYQYDGKRAQLWLEDGRVPECLRIIVNRGHALQRVAVERPSLEDYFLHIAREQRAGATP